MDESNNFGNQLKVLKHSKDVEKDMHLRIVNLETKNSKLKDDLKVLHDVVLQKDAEIATLKVQNLEINQTYS